MFVFVFFFLFSLHTDSKQTFLPLFLPFGVYYFFLLSEVWLICWLRHNPKLSVVADKNWEIISWFWDSEGKRKNLTVQESSWSKAIELYRKSTLLLIGRIANLRCSAGWNVQSKFEKIKKKNKKQPKSQNRTSFPFKTRRYCNWKWNWLWGFVSIPY